MNSCNPDYTRSKDEILSLLERNKISATSQRVAIAAIILDKPQHLSAEQVLRRAVEHAVNVSKATVYNTLNLFTEKGLLKEVIVESGKVFFDSNTSEHFHFYNEKTGELHDFQLDELLISKMPDLPNNTVKTSMDVIVKIESKDS